MSESNLHKRGVLACAAKYHHKCSSAKSPFTRATKLTNNQWRIAESALVEALDKGINFAALPKKTGKKQKQPEHLRQRQEEMRQTKAQAATTTTTKAAKPAKKPAAAPKTK